MARGTPEPPRGQRGRKRKPGPPLARRAQAGRRPGEARGHWGHVCFAASTFVDCAGRNATSDTYLSSRNSIFSALFEWEADLLWRLA